MPDNASDAPLHARLIVRRETAGLAGSFDNRFSRERQTYFEQPLEDARVHLAAGRKNEALEAYKLALSRNRGDWLVAMPLPTSLHRLRLLGLDTGRRRW